MKIAKMTVSFTAHIAELTNKDLRLARDAGVKGCILSNHGGRQLDRARAGFDSLRRIREQDPAILQQLEIYVDGGARRGTDVLMALALGAKGVGMGRPFLYAQAAYGEKGAIRAVRSECFLCVETSRPRCGVGMRGSVGADGGIQNVCWLEGVHARGG